MKMKKLLFICIPILLVVVVSVILVLQFIPNRNVSITTAKKFSDISKIGGAEIDTIEVQSDWGKHKEITSKQDINSIIHFLDRYKYKKNSSMPNSIGYLYKLSFSSKNKTLATCEIQSNPVINDEKYETVGNKMDTSEIIKIVGIEMPK